jgi:hypothetical protein
VIRVTRIVDSSTLTFAKKNVNNLLFAAGHSL